MLPAAEVVAISEAQKTVGSTNLDDCTIYANVEPCALCSYAIRESRIARVVYAMRSPIMGECLAGIYWTIGNYPTRCRKFSRGLPI